MQVRFPTPLRITETGDGTTWRLTEQMLVEYGSKVIAVPADFLTDFASIPRVFRAIVPVLGRQNKPSVWHDYMYVSKPVSRRDADWLFLEALESVGVGWLKRNAMWAAVRIGGGPVWRG